MIFMFSCIPVLAASILP
jgi:ABC-type metal ion transport system substrate-binding protein